MKSEISTLCHITRQGESYNLPVCCIEQSEPLRRVPLAASSFNTMVQHAPSHLHLHPTVIAAGRAVHGWHGVCVKQRGCWIVRW